jgi:HEAT repeat protein
MTMLELSGWAQSIDALEAFFAEIQRTPPEREVSLNVINSMLDSVKDYPPSGVQRLMAAIRTPLRHADLNVRRAAGATLLALAIMRMDGATALKGHLDLLEEVLSDPDPIMADVALLSIGVLKPVPPPEAVQVLLRFASKPEADPRLRARAIGGALRASHLNFRFSVADQRELALAAAEQFMRSNPPREGRAALLGVLGSALEGFRSQRLDALVVAGLSDQDPGVRDAALVSLINLGPEAIRKSIVEVERMRTQDPDERLRIVADQALRIMAGERIEHLGVR